MTVIMCGPNPPSDDDLRIVEAFTRYLKREITLDEFNEICQSVAFDG